MVLASQFQGFVRDVGASFSWSSVYYWGFWFPGTLGPFSLFGLFFPGGTQIPPFYRGFLAVLAAFLALTSKVSMLSFFFGTLSFFLVNLYTWYWFFKFFRLKIEK